MARGSAVKLLLLLSGQAAVAAAGPGSGDVAASTHQLTLATFAATINAVTEVLASTASLTLTANAATVNAATNVQASADTLTLTGQAATVNAATNVQASTDSLTLTEQAAGVNAATNVLAAADALTLATFAAGVEAGGSFDPLSIGWHTAFWAEGPEFEALGLSDTDPVATWPDEVSTNDVTQATESNKPTYRAADASLNNKPAVHGDGGDNLQSGSFTLLSQPTTIVAVVRFDTTGEHVPFDGNDSSNRQQAWYSSVANTVSIYAGATKSTTGKDTLGHLWIAEFDSTDSLTQDGSVIISGNAGANGIDGVTLFSDNGGLGIMTGSIAFYGLLDGTLTAQEKSDLLAWSRSYYGTP